VPDDSAARRPQAPHAARISLRAVCSQAWRAAPVETDSG